MEAVRVNLSSMNFSGSMLPLDGRISKMSPLNIINKYVLTKKINKLYYTVLIYIYICMFIYIPGQTGGGLHCDVGRRGKIEGEFIGF